MPIDQLLWSLGLMPLFASRVFLPAFLFALLLAFPDCFPFVEVGEAVAVDSWLTSTPVLIGLGALTVIEFLADKNPDLQEWLLQFGRVAKPIAYLAVSLQLVDPATQEVLENLQLAGFAYDWRLLVLIAGAIGVVAIDALRRIVYDLLLELDDDGSLGIRQAVGYFEDGFVLFGFLLFIAAAVVALVFYALMVLALLLLRARIDRRAERAKTPCVNCGVRIPQVAPQCYNCRTPQPAVHHIGWLAQPKATTITDDLRDHRLQLVTQGRCPVCSHKLSERRYDQTCRSCGTSVVAIVPLSTFHGYIRRRFAIMLAAGVGLGFIPIFGFVTAVVANSVYVLAPLRRYRSRGANWLSKLGARLLFLMAVSLGAAVGFVMAPIYIVLRYLMLRRGV